MRDSITLAALWVIALVALIGTAFAPSPLPRRVKAEDHTWLHGRWIMKWGGEPHGCDYDTTFTPDGAYSAYGAGTLWVGSWTTAGRRVTVRERPADSTVWAQWTFDFGPDPSVIAGTHYRGTRLTFRRPLVTD